jgi:hypothetical protein
MEFLQSHAVWALTITIVVLLLSVVCWRLILKHRSLSDDGLSIDERAYDSAYFIAKRSSRLDASYLPRGGDSGNTSTREPRGVAGATGSRSAGEPHRSLSVGEHSISPGADPPPRSTQAVGSERSPSAAPSADELLLPSRRSLDESVVMAVRKVQAPPLDRPHAASQSARDEAFARVEDQLDHIQHRLADINLTASQILQILIREDRGGTPPPEPRPRTPRPAVRRATTIEDIVQFWNERADWHDPDASIGSYQEPILRDGWWISKTVMSLYRLVYQRESPLRLFLFPYLKKAKKYYQTDFFLVSGSSDSKELVRPAEVQLRKPGSSVDHKIDELLGGRTPLSEVFQVVQKGEIV